MVGAAGLNRKLNYKRGEGPDDHRCRDEEEAIGGSLTQHSEVPDPEIISDLWHRLKTGEVCSFESDLAVGARCRVANPSPSGGR